MNPRILIPATCLLLATGCGIKPHPIYRSQPRPAPAAHSKTAAAAPVTGQSKSTGKTTAPQPAPASQKKLQSVINAYLGTPYKYGGTTKKGIDCSGFMQQIYRQGAGIKLPRTAADIYRQGNKIPQRRLRYGDMVFFGRSVSSIDHVGFYTGNNRFVHASSSRGVIYAGLNEKYFRRRYRGAVRVIR